MDNLVNIAIIGTGQATNIPFTTGLPTDALQETLVEESLEHQLLLAAGNASVYRRAGYVPAVLPEAMTVSELEEQAYCSSKIHYHLTSLLKEKENEVLVEMLSLMQKAKVLIPSQLLPSALDIGVSYPKYQVLLYPLLGNRGHWLSQFQAQWAWAGRYRPEALTQDLERFWQEGSIEQRKAVLSHARSVDPEMARNWLVQTWQKEQVQTRKIFLSSFEGNLSLADEDFLEKALDDRSPDIQKQAARLLAQLQESAFRKRMESRAESFLTIQDTRIKIALPENTDLFWKHDGLEWSLPADLQNSVNWIVQILEWIPLSFWENHFQFRPEQLVGSIKNSAEDQIVVIGWSKAAQHTPNSSWIVPLWHWWQQIGRQKETDHSWAYTSLHSHQQEIDWPSLLQNANQQDSESLLIESIENEKEWENLVGSLAKPWSPEFSSFFLQRLTEHLSNAKKNIQSYQNPWYNTLLEVANALPPECFGLARDIQRAQLAEKEKRTHQQITWDNQIDRFQKIMLMRQQIREELQG